MAIRAISSRPNAEMHHAMPERSISCPIRSSSGTSVASCSRVRVSYRLADRTVTGPVPRSQRLLVRLAEAGERQRVDGDDLLGRLHRAFALLDHVLDLVDHVVGELVPLAEH